METAGDDENNGGEGREESRNKEGRKGGREEGRKGGTGRRVKEGRGRVVVKGGEEKRRGREGRGVRLIEYVDGYFIVN